MKEHELLSAMLSDCIALRGGLEVGPANPELGLGWQGWR